MNEPACCMVFVAGAEAGGDSVVTAGDAGIWTGVMSLFWLV